MNEQKKGQQDPLTSLILEFGVRLNELEEKQRLLRDRTLLIGENLISLKEESSKENLDFKKQINRIEVEIKELKQLNKRIINEIGNFARKTELEILERQMKMFQPLEFARIKDIKKIIEEGILKTKNLNKEKNKDIREKNRDLLEKEETIESLFEKKE
jgi:hypothetical protein